MNASAKRAARPRLRFTLQLLLALITLLCIVLANWTQRARQQRQVVERIRANYGSVTYDYEPQPTPKLYEPRSPLPVWLINLLGEDFFHNIVRAHVRGNVDLSAVSGLRSISDLVIWKADLTDEELQNLAPLTRLERLVIQSDKHVPETTQVGDASLALIAKLPRLEVVYVDGEGFTAAGLAELAKSQSLQSVYVRYCDASVTSSAAEPFADRVASLTLLRRLPDASTQDVSSKR
jgi:hypothetical protein